MSGGWEEADEPLPRPHPTEVGEDGNAAKLYCPDLALTGKKFSVLTSIDPIIIFPYSNER